MVSATKNAESRETKATTTAENALIVKSPFPDVEPVLGITISEFLRAETAKYHDSSAIVLESFESGVKYTYKDVFDMSFGFAAGLLQLGIQRQDVVGVVLPNIPEYLSVVNGIWDAGAICTLINPTYGLDEMKWQLENSEAKFVVTIPALVPAFEALKKTCVETLQIIVVGSTTGSSRLSFFELIKTDTNGVAFLAGSDIDTTEEIAILPYSSGTTGLAKGVMLTHSSVCTNILQISQKGVMILEERGIGIQGPSAERFVSLLPFYHVYGMLTCFLGIRYGVHCLTVAKFEPSSYLKILRTHKPTFLHVVPPIVAMLADSPLVTKEDLKSVKVFLCGAAPIGATLINRLLEKVGNNVLFQEGYGMTEMSPCTHMLNPLIPVCKSKIGSIGYLLPSTMAKIISTDGSNRSLGPNENGELLVAGPQMMKGYLKNEEATRSTIDSEGWLHTGDIGYYDADNCFYIADRLKELIKVKGEQVAPAELEDTLRHHPLIMDAAVIGIPNELAGELPRAYIVRKSDELTEKDVMDFVKGKLAYFKQLKGGVQFVQAIPKAPTGKILRRVLRQEYAQQNARIQPLTENLSNVPI